MLHLKMIYHDMIFFILISFSIVLYFLTKMKSKAFGFMIFPFNVKRRRFSETMKMVWQIFFASSELSE